MQSTRANLPKDYFILHIPFWISRGVVSLGGCPFGEPSFGGGGGGGAGVFDVFFCGGPFGGGGGGGAGAFGGSLGRGVDAGAGLGGSFGGAKLSGRKSCPKGGAELVDSVLLDKKQYLVTVYKVSKLLIPFVEVLAHKRPLPELVFINTESTSSAPPFGQRFAGNNWALGKRPLHRRVLNLWFHK
ncbi:17852_t:CDS:2 [Rhizophagus irregularis]|nr:17852_t:CDS:2 [Rhizophagus irregularis]